MTAAYAIAVTVLAGTGWACWFFEWVRAAALEDVLAGRGRR